MPNCLNQDQGRYAGSDMGPSVKVYLQSLIILAFLCIEGLLSPMDRWRIKGSNGVNSTHGSTYTRN